jgi:hypothetical protein
VVNTVNALPRIGKSLFDSRHVARIEGSQRDDTINEPGIGRLQDHCECPTHDMARGPELETADDHESKPAVT